MEFDLVKAAALGVRLAHQPLAAGLHDLLPCRCGIIHPDPEMVQADMVAPGTLGRLIRFEMQQREVDHAIGQEDAFGKARIGLADHLHPEHVFVEFGGLPRVRHPHGDMAQLSHRFLPDFALLRTPGMAGMCIAPAGSW